MIQNDGKQDVFPTRFWRNTWLRGWIHACFELSSPRWRGAE